jgi:hypothetical protein
MQEYNIYCIIGDGKMDYEYELIRKEVDKLINHTKDKYDTETGLDSKNNEFRENMKISNIQRKLLINFLGYKLYFISNPN